LRRKKAFSFRQKTQAWEGETPILEACGGWGKKKQKEEKGATLRHTASSKKGKTVTMRGGFGYGVKLADTEKGEKIRMDVAVVFSKGERIGTSQNQGCAGRVPGMNGKPWTSILTSF